MTTNKLFSQEPSQEALDFLKETMRLRFSQVKDQHPVGTTTRVQDKTVIVEMWSDTGKLIMSEEDSVGYVIELGEMFKKHPQRRAQMLAFFAEGISLGTQH